MTQERTLPIAAAHREFVVLANGEAVPRGEHLLSLTLSASADRIASARLVYQDGAASESDFRLSGSDLLVPGVEVEIKAGPGEEQVTLFKGLVLRQELKVRPGRAPELVIYCKHRALKMAAGRKGAYFLDQSDSEVIEQLLQEAGLQAEVESTAARHEQLVQFDASDWDFALLRARANGLSIFTRAEDIAVRRGALDGEPVCTLTFGATVLKADLRLDARRQFQAVSARSWDPAAQELSERQAEDPGIRSPGDLDSEELGGVAGPSELVRRHGALGEDEAQAWADSTLRRSRLNRVCGRLECEGIGTVFPGDLVTLAGLGDRFNGAALVTGVRHQYDLVNGWKTNLQVGGLPQPEALGDEPSAEAAGGLAPSINGLQLGVVVSNEDPRGEYRVRVRMPLVDDQDDGAWARVACLDAGAERGFFIRPEIGDEVLLGFLDDDPRQPVLLGMLHSSAHTAPLEGSDDNHEKLFRTRSGMRVSFDDENSVMSLETPAGNRLTLDERDEAVSLVDQHDNRIVMNADGILVESASSLQLKAASDIAIEAGGLVDVKGGTELKMEGAAGAEMSSSAIAKISGSLVQIN